MRDVVHGVGQWDGRRQRGTRLERGDGIRGYRDHTLEAGRGLEPLCALRRADHEAAVERGRHVVRMALDLDRVRIDARGQLVHVVGGHEPRDNRGRAGPKASRKRDLGADPKREPVGGMQLLERLDAQVRAIQRDAVDVRLDAEVARLLDLELQMQRQRRGEAVVTGAEIRRARGDANQSAPIHASTADSRAPNSGSHEITPGARSIAVVGSFSPCPVSTQTTVPSTPYFNRPATDAADAGSQNTPSFIPRNAYASRISASETARIWPRELVTASIASSQRAGFPMRIADATVSGFSTGAPCTSGAAPSAWKPYSFGATSYSLKPRHHAVMLPALPTGMHSTSGGSPKASQTSNAAVFCPSIRYSLTELTKEIGCLDASSRTSVSAWSKLPRNATTRAPCMSACASFPAAIFPSGTMTAPRRPARAAYAAALAAVLPVDAHNTASAPSPTAADTATVMPRSLNDPVGFAPSTFSHTSDPTRSDKRGARTSGVSPSSRVTSGSTGSRSR